MNGSQAYGRGRYRASQLNVLLNTYVRIRGDLLLEWPSLQSPPPGSDEAEGHEDVTGRQQAAIVCAEFLQAARQELESRRANLPVVANLLGLADRMLVSLYRTTILRLRAQTVEGELDAMRPRPLTQLAVLRTVKRQAFSGSGASSDELDELRTALKDGLTFCTAATSELSSRTTFRSVACARCSSMCSSAGSC